MLKDESREAKEGGKRMLEGEVRAVLQSSVVHSRYNRYRKNVRVTE